MIQWLKQLFRKENVAMSSEPIQLGPCYVLKDGKQLFECENIFVGYLNGDMNYPTVNLITREE